MGEFKIEKNVPITQSDRSGKWKQLALEMKKGDSVLLPTRMDAMGLRAAGKHLKYGMSIRATEGKFRVWRMS